ncbi:reverse transcriptase domain-containing protein [Tanacetum coccineum]
MRFPDVPSTSIKLMLFPFSLEGSARIWLEKEPPRSILTWDDLVSKFINQFFPPSKMTNLRNEITRFQQRFDESFYEAWDRFNDLLRACPHHGFSELHQLDTFYNALNANDQDSLNSAAGGNFLDKMPRECLRIIESKSKVRNSRNKAVVAKVSSNSSTPGISPDVAALTTEVSELKNLMKTMLIDKQKVQAPASVKAVEQSCVTCGDYQAPPQQMQGVSKTNFENYVKANVLAKHSSSYSIFRKLFQVKTEIARRISNLYAISVIDFSKDEPFSASTTNHSDTLPPSSSSGIKDLVDNLEVFARSELNLLKKDVHFQVYSNPLFEFDDNFTSSNVNLLFNEMDIDVENKNSNVSNSDEPVLLNTPLSNKDECFAPEDDIDINAFLAMEVSSNFEEGYFNSEGDVTFLDNLLSDDTTHNLAPEVIFDHEPEQNESSITFSPRSDPLHHEFAGELLTLPSRNDREHEDYLVYGLCLLGISTSWFTGNVHAIQNDSEDEDNECPNLDHQDDPSIPRPPPEPPDVEKCLEPEAGILITKVFKGVSKPHDFMADILPTLPTLVLDLTVILFLSSFLSFGSEDLVFDPGIFTFHFSLKTVPFALPKDE